MTPDTIMPTTQAQSTATSSAKKGRKCTASTISVQSNPGEKKKKTKGTVGDGSDKVIDKGKQGKANRFLCHFSFIFSRLTILKENISCTN